MCAIAITKGHQDPTLEYIIISQPSKEGEREKETERK